MESLLVLSGISSLDEVEALRVTATGAVDAAERLGAEAEMPSCVCDSLEDVIALLES